MEKFRAIKSKVGETSFNRAISKIENDKSLLTSLSASERDYANTFIKHEYYHPIGLTLRVTYIEIIEYAKRDIYHEAIQNYLKKTRTAKCYAKILKAISYNTAFQIIADEVLKRSNDTEVLRLIFEQAVRNANFAYIDAIIKKGFREIPELGYSENARKMLDSYNYIDEKYPEIDLGANVNNVIFHCCTAEEYEYFAAKYPLTKNMNALVSNENIDFVASIFEVFEPTVALKIDDDLYELIKDKIIPPKHPIYLRRRSNIIDYMSKYASFDKMTDKEKCDYYIRNYCNNPVRHDLIDYFDNDDMLLDMSEWNNFIYTKKQIGYLKSYRNNGFVFDNSAYMYNMYKFIKYKIYSCLYLSENVFLKIINDENYNSHYYSYDSHIIANLCTYDPEKLKYLPREMITGHINNCRNCPLHRNVKRAAS